MANKSTKVVDEPVEKGVKASASLPSPFGAEGVDRIRDILFGSQIEAYEERFKSLEASFKKRLDSLESLIKSQVRDFTKGLEAETAKRKAAVTKLADKQQPLRKEMEAGLAELAGELKKSVERLGDRLDKESGRVRSELKSESEKISQLLETRHQEIQEEHIDRAELASLLTKLAKSLAEAKARKK